MSLLHRRVLGVLLALLTATALVSLRPGGAGAVSSAPTGIVVDALTSAVQAPPGTRAGAVPTLLVKGGIPADGNFTQYDVQVRVHLTGLTTDPAFTKDTTVSLSASNPAGSVPLTRTSAVFPKGVTSAVLVTSVAVPANQVTLTVSLPGKKATDFSPGTSVSFDALVALTTSPATVGTSFTGGIGGSGGACADATPTSPVCGVATLPRGAYSDVFLSQGVCDAAYTRCNTAGSVVQLLADIDGTAPLYSPTSPFTVLMKCDKSLCGGGAIKDTVVNVALDGNAALAPIPPCPAKGVVGATQTSGCVDFVQSTRDNAGDTLLFVLLPGDARVSIG